MQSYWSPGARATKQERKAQWGCLVGAGANRTGDAITAADPTPRRKSRMKDTLSPPIGRTEQGSLGNKIGKILPCDRGKVKMGLQPSTCPTSVNISASVCVHITYMYINSIMGKFVNGRKDLDESSEWPLAQKLCLYPLVV